MKKMLVVALVLSSFSIFADHHEGHKKQKQVVMCKKECGAEANSSEEVRDCKVVRLKAGCFCGSAQEVAQQIANCHK